MILFVRSCFPLKISSDSSFLLKVHIRLKDAALQMLLVMKRTFLPEDVGNGFLRQLRAYSVSSYLSFKFLR